MILRDGQKYAPFGQKKTVEFFFGHFCDVKKPIKRLGKPVRTQKKHIAKIFYLAELQEFPIQPNPAVWADLARTSSSCSSERKKDFCNLVFGFGLVCPEV